MADRQDDCAYCPQAMTLLRETESELDTAIADNGSLPGYTPNLRWCMRIPEVQNTKPY